MTERRTGPAGGASTDPSPSPDGAAPFISGVPIPVDPERIERELARMWKPGEGRPAEEGGPVTRACLSNLIIDLPSAAAPPCARDALLEIARRFPSRMILLVREEGRPAGAARLSAWVTALCHRPDPDAPPICCEVISLQACGDCTDLLRGAVLPLLVPDVPVILFLPEGDLGTAAELLARTADRIIVDSRSSAPSRLAAIPALLELREGLAADDIAWRESAGLRWAIADIFEDPGGRGLLQGLRRIEAIHEPVPGAASRGEGAAGAALLAGWLLSRLGWRFSAKRETRSGLEALFERDGRTMEVALRPADRSSGEPGSVISVRLEAGDRPGTAYLEACCDGGLLRIERPAGEKFAPPRTMSLRRRTYAELLGEALERTTHQGVFRGAIDLAKEFT